MFKAMIPAYLTGLGTMSSAITMPHTFWNKQRQLRESTKESQILPSLCLILSIKHLRESELL